MVEVIIEDREGQRLDNYLFQIFKSTPNSHIYRMLRKGRIRINGKVCRDNTYRLEAGDVLIMPTPINDSQNIVPSEQLIQKVKDMVVAETEDYWLINKQAGICVHKSERDIFGVIEVMQYVFTDAHLVHRIDRNTSGCLLIAKSYQSLSRLQSQWRAHQVKKVYQLVVCGQWGQDNQVRVSKPLLRIDANNRAEKVIGSEKGKSAVTLFRVLRRFKDYTLLEAEILTGRTHQIRVHAASIGFPILGDGRYGQSKNDLMSGMFLHAKELTLANDQVLTCDLSNELSATLDQLSQADQ